MKIAYLHGLESSIDPKDPKIIFMNKTFDEVYTPSINYKDNSTFSNLLNDIKKMQPDLIVGSSLGGYVSYLIGSKLSIKTILFNPAMVGRSFDPMVDDASLRSSTHNVYFGKNDKVIDGSAVKKYFNEDGVGSFKYNSYSGGHRVPSDVFIDAIKNVLNITEVFNLSVKYTMKHIKLFEDFITERYLSGNTVKGLVYHASGVEIKRLTTDPMWFALEKSHSTEGWLSNIISNGLDEAYQYQGTIQGKICDVTDKEIETLFQNNGLDVEDWVIEIVSNPSADDVMELEGTKLLIKTGFVGAIYSDYDPRDFDADLEALIVFNPLKSVKGWKLVKKYP